MQEVSLATDAAMLHDGRATGVAKPEEVSPATEVATLSEETGRKSRRHCWGGRQLRRHLLMKRQHCLWGGQPCGHHTLVRGRQIQRHGEAG